MKRWKNSASIILVAGKHITSASLSTPVEQHSQIIGRRQFNYEVLMLKRSSRSSAFASAHVFPGGVLDRADYSNDWLALLDKRKFPAFALEGNRPEALLYESKTSIPPDVAFRICAIRETFEETGILITKPIDAENKLSVSTYNISKPESNQWRKMVAADAKEFLNLCKHHDMVPNVGSLSEWSNWLTPSFVQGKRFDTMFYLACLDTVIDVEHDECEIDHSEWYTPTSILRGHRNGHLSLIPPQFYELSRLINFHDLAELRKFAQTRQSKGSIRFYPIFYKFADEACSIYPGDDLYPALPDFEQQGEFSSNLSVSKSASECVHLNRTLWPTQKKCFPICNINCCGHVNPPSGLEELLNLEESKL